MAFGALDTLFGRIFTRNYDAKDQSRLRDFFRDNLTPPGVVSFILSSAALPAGWLRCEGQLVSKATYPDLFAAIGYSVGGSGDSFKLPDMRNRIPIGAGDVAMGEAMGNRNITLTVGQMPAHTHGVNDGPHSHGLTQGAVEVQTGSTAAAGQFLCSAATADGAVTLQVGGGVVGASAANITNLQSGNGEAIDILPPVFGLVAIMKV